MTWTGAGCNGGAKQDEQDVFYNSLSNPKVKLGVLRQFGAHFNFLFTLSSPKFHRTALFTGEDGLAKPRGHF